jgi:hypothetical protein
MTTDQGSPMSRRSAFGLAAVLAATMLTGAAAVDGLLHARPAAPAAARSTRVVVPATITSLPVLPAPESPREVD